MSAKKKEALTRGKRLRMLREDLNLTRLQFAEKMNISVHTLKAFENGDRVLTEVMVREYCRRFVLEGMDVSFDFLYHGNDPSYLDVKEASIDDDLNIQKEILSFKASNPLSIIFRVPDSLMAPVYNEGDMVGGQKVMDETKFPLFHNHICLIEGIKGTQCLRKIIKSDQRKITACTLNATAADTLPIIEEIEAFFVAQVTRHWHLSNIIRNLHNEFSAG